MEKLGLLSMGETPRTDILPVMKREMPDVELVEYGILDGLDAEARRALEPLPGDFPLVSRLRDGSQCSLGKKQAAALLEQGLQALHAQGVRTVVLLCTCRFSLNVPEGMLVLEAGRIIDSAVDAVAREGGTVGLLAPLAEQGRELTEHYSSLPCRFVTAAASPYEDVRKAEAAAAALKGADVVLLHCMGYTAPYREAVRRVCHCPVIQANSLVARFAAELVNSEE